MPYMAAMPLSIVHHPNFRIDMARNRRFPSGKFRRIAEIIEAENLTGGSEFRVPEPVTAADISLAHHPDYVEQVLACDVPDRIEREIGFPVREQLVLRARLASGGTLLAARTALSEGIACNTAGGGHHARQTQGAGFCVFNDVGVAVRALQTAGEIERALIIDCDVHQGDGTADLFADDPRVFTFSIHGEKNYPVRKVASDLDIGLPDGAGDDDYLAALSSVLAGLFRTHDPDIVFFNAGVDPHRDDDLGRLNMSDDGLRERERRVIGAARDHDVPIACVVGGGYSKDIEALAERHVGLYRVAAEFA